MLTDAQARALIGGLAIVIAAIIAALAWGQNALNTTLVAAILWLLYDRVPIHERAEQAQDDADIARGKAEAIEAHLTGLEPEGTGRHAHPRGG